MIDEENKSKKEETETDDLDDMDDLDSDFLLERKPNPDYNVGLLKGIRLG